MGVRGLAARPDLGRHGATGRCPPLPRTELQDFRVLESVAAEGGGGESSREMSPGATWVAEALMGFSCQVQIKQGEGEL